MISGVRVVSELDDEGCGARLVGLIIAAVIMVIILNVVTGAIEKRDNWIRDLQRRVGQLESERQ